MRTLVALLLLSCFSATGRAAEAPGRFPIYLEDNHAGSFYWLAQRLNLEEGCTLVLFDAHSDASAVFDSDDVRQKLRHAISVAERERRLEQWRQSGTVQCFGWIEPLMPAPIAQVIWVPGEKLTPTEANQRRAKAVSFLDGFSAISPRHGGSFAHRYRVAGLEALRGHLPNGTPLVVSLDLDYFAGMEPGAQAAAFERVWRFVVEQRHLLAVTFAISRPYLKDDAEAHRLVKLAVDAALSIPTATLDFEPFAAVANDRSLRATELRNQHLPVSSYDMTGAPWELRAALLAHRERIKVRRDTARWDALLQAWSHGAK